MPAAAAAAGLSLKEEAACSLPQEAGLSDGALAAAAGLALALEEADARAAWSLPNAADDLTVAEFDLRVREQLAERARAQHKAEMPARAAAAKAAKRRARRAAICSRRRAGEHLWFAYSFAARSCHPARSCQWLPALVLLAGAAWALAIGIQLTRPVAVEGSCVLRAASVQAEDDDSHTVFFNATMRVPGDSATYDVRASSWREPANGEHRTLAAAKDHAAATGCAAVPGDGADSSGTMDLFCGHLIPPHGWSVALKTAAGDDTLSFTSHHW